MSRVLITGGAGAIGGAVARRLLADPAYDVRICDRRTAPLWMREGCEIRDGDLRAPAQALAATKGCALVVHLASYAPADGRADAAPYALLEHENAVHAAVVRAAVERRVERFVYISTAAVFERAERAPTPESDLASCPAPRSARAFARLAGERYCTAAHEQHGLPFALCRPSAVYGAAASAGAGEPGMEPLVGELIAAALRGEHTFELDGPSERTCTPTHVKDVADGIVLALGSEAALNEDFNLAGPREVTLGELARIVWEAAGAGTPTLTLKSGERTDATPERGWPASEKAHELLGWRPRIAFEDGIAATVAALREQAAAGAAAASAVG
jgi:UDP-glucose 4-epimerase